jgi:hypothetical protein
MPVASYTPFVMLDRHTADDATERPETTDDAPAPAALSGHLADARRRTTLDVLAGDGPTLELDDLARRVAAQEADLPPPEVTGERYDRVVADLYESHLPALDEDGVVDLDREEGVYVTVSGGVAGRLD